MKEGLDPKRSHESLNFSREERTFLDDVYLKKEYIVDANVETAIKDAVESLKSRFPENFTLLTLVGGQANGSYVLRQKQNRRYGTDVDFYLGGFKADGSTLDAMSKEVASHMQIMSLSPDGLLNGKELDRYLDLFNIESHIEHEDFDILALPFQCAFGDVVEAQRIVLEAVAKNQNANSVWDQIREYHRQSLYLSNGQWPIEFNDAILKQYADRKITNFELPGLEDMLMRVNHF